MPKPSPRFFPLLPYLSDRSQQETALRRALEPVLQKNSRRPFLCIIHGDEYECHDKYLERLQHLALPKIFNTRHAIKDFLLSWPAGGLEHFSETLRVNLAAALAGDSAVSSPALNRTLVRYAAPVLLHTHLLTDDWRHGGTAAAQAFIKFWQDWPDLAPAQQLVVALFLKYQRAEKSRFWQPDKRIKLNRAIRDFFAALDFQPPDRLHGVVLPELPAISQGEAEDWVREHARDFCDPGELLPQIRELYKRGDLRAPDGSIPMEYLAEELKKLLQRYSRG